MAESQREKSMLKKEILSLSLGALLVLGGGSAVAGPTIIEEGFDVQMGGGIPPAAADILWVIDDSGSMATYQMKLAAAAPRFMKALGVGNWKLGAITTDSAGKSIGLASGTELTSSDSVTTNLFVSWISNIGTSGSATEAPFDSAIAHLSANPGFLRQGAELILIIVTDAPEQSKATQTDLIAALRQNDPLKVITPYFFLSGTDLGCASTNDPFTYTGSKFELLSTALGSVAKVGSLCAADFETKIEAVGSQVPRGMGTGPIGDGYLRLMSTPDATTIEVLFNGRKLPAGPAGKGNWLYDPSGNAIVLTDTSYLPAGTSEIRVRYAKK